MFYGWGRRSKDWQMHDGVHAVVTYSYVSLMFIFHLAYKQQWQLVGRDRAMDTVVSREELAARYGTDAPQLGMWNRFGLLMAIAAFVCVVVVVGVLGG
jgi:hypothetical protein